MRRWQTISSNVKENIERYNQISQRNSDGGAVFNNGVCFRCNSHNISDVNHRPATTIGLLSLPIEINDIRTENVPEPPEIIVKTAKELPTDEQQQTEQRPASNIDTQKLKSKIKLRRVISFTETEDDDNATNQEDIRILEICRTRNLVSKLTKKFDNITNNGKTTTKSASHFRRLNDNFLNKSFSRVNSKSNDTDPKTTEQHTLEDLQQNDNNNMDYFVIEKTEIFEVKDKVKPNVSPLIITKRSHSIGEITRNRKSSPTTPVTPLIGNFSATPKLQSSMENILENDAGVQLRHQNGTHLISAKRISVDNVATVEDILQQERFSKCFSEYSISDLLNELPDDDDDMELTNFLNKIK